MGNDAPHMSKAKLLVPANDNKGGRYIVTLQSRHCIFPAKLRQHLSDGEEPNLILRS